MAAPIKSWLGACVVLLAGAICASAANCVGCGVAVKAAAARPFNAAFGVDSDGCAYAMDGRKERRVLGLDRVVECRSCGLAYDLDHPLPQAAGLIPKTRAHRAEQGLSAPLSPSARHELAAWVHGQAGAEPALQAELLLRAAWAYRAELVLGEPHERYAPRSVPEARRSVDALVARASYDPYQESAPRQIDDTLSGLDLGRSRLEQQLEASKDPQQRVRLLRELEELATTERALLDRKAVALRAANARRTRNPQDLRRATLAAWVRYGSPARAGALLKDLPEAVRKRVRPLLREERRLLLAAGARFEEAASKAAPREAPKLLFLAAECARRAGSADASGLYARVTGLAPTGPLAARVGHLRAQGEVR